MTVKAKVSNALYVTMNQNWSPDTPKKLYSLYGDFIYIDERDNRIRSASFQNFKQLEEWVQTWRPDLTELSVYKPKDPNISQAFISVFETPLHRQLSVGNGGLDNSYDLSTITEFSEWVEQHDK